jgi:hypothetical protein
MPENVFQCAKRVLVVLCLLAIAAEAETAEGTQAAKEQGASVKRDPFWPVGYAPKSLKQAAPNSADPKKPQTGNAWSQAMKKVVINGVSSKANNEFIAVINGEIKGVNDLVMIRHENTMYTWVVDMVKPPGSVKLRRVSAQGLSK